MIWGEIVNSVRSFNYDFLSEFRLDPKLCLKEMQLAAADFPYPEQIDDFDEWNEFIPGNGLEDILPLHPVERVLVEGPLLPIQKIDFNSKSEVDVLYAAIFSLQKEWCDQLKLTTPERMLFLEKSCVSNALRISNRLGFIKLNALS